MDSWKEKLSLLTDPNERWVLLVGGQLGASSGVPLPFQRTPWSPSIIDLVRYHIFRTQSREVSESVQRALGEGKPPLGFIADDLEGQVEWLKTYTDNISPQRTVIRLADLIKGGMFHSLVSNAPDDLLERALALLQIEYQTLSLEQPTGQPGVLTLLKEHDDLIFQDTTDRRTREASFIKSQLEAMLAKADGVVFVGCHPYASDLMNGVVRVCQQRPELKLVWLDEQRREKQSNKQGLTATAWLTEHHPHFHRLQADDMGDMLDAIAQARGINPSPILATPAEAQSGLVGLLNRSFDVKPILIYVPGMALFSGILDKLPQISLKALLSLATLLLVILGLLNFREYQSYEKQLSPARSAYQSALQSLGTKTSTYQQLVRADKELDLARKQALATPAPKPSLISVPLLQSHLKRRRQKLLENIGATRSQKIIPQMVQRRLQRRLNSDPLLRNMGHFPDVSVSVKQREVEDDNRLQSNEGKDKQGSTQSTRKSKSSNPFSSTQQVRPLNAHKKKQYLALFATSSMLLQVVMKQQMRLDLKAKRLVIPIHLDRAEGRPLAQILQQTLQQLAGYGTKADPRFHREGIDQWLNAGKASFYFLQLDTSGGVSKNLERINALLTRYPRCRGILATYLKDTFQRIANEAKRFVRLEIEQYKQRQARQFLHSNTSHRFFRGVMNNSYLRWSMTRPLVMSLLINYYRWVGRPPRSLGVIYDRLLRTMLQGSQFDLPNQFQALGVLAYDSLANNTDQLHRERAYQLIAKRTKLSLTKAAALLDELVKRGVMRYPSLTDVRFMDKHFQYLGVARELLKLPFDKRRRFLLGQHQKLISFYAGIQPKLTKLVKAWLDDYDVIDRALRQKGRQQQWLNPHLPALKYAALAVNNGDVDYVLVKRLEKALFAQLSHKRYKLLKDTVSWGLTHMSTPGVKQTILQGIEGDAPYDYRLFRLASMAPQDIYVGATQRWMRRVRTAGDRQAKRRQLRRTSTSFGRAISLLVGLGTPDAIQTALQYARQDKDPRFPSRHWRTVRLYAIYMLMVRGYFSEVTPILEHLLSKQPHHWPFLVSRLYKANNRRAAELLVKIITQPGPFALASAKSPRQRREARRWLKVKRSAALALARLDEDLSIPALKAALRSQKGLEDYRPYIALAIGRRGERSHFPLVEALHKKWKTKRWPANTPSKLKRKLTMVLAKAVALFGTNRAFRLLAQMNEKEWRKRHQLRHHAIDPVAWYIKRPIAERYYTTRLLCHAKTRRKYEKYRLLLRLASIQTPSARSHINQLLQIKLGRHATRYYRGICGAKGTPTKAMQSFRKASGIDDFVWALGRFQEPVDLPRFARWSLHSDRLVRRAAYVALGRYSQAEASAALRTSLKRHPGDASRIIRTLGRQRQRSNELPLLRLLQTQVAQWRRRSRAKKGQPLQKQLITTIRALAHTGTQASVLQLYPLLGDSLLSSEASRSITRLLHRHKGVTWNQKAILSAIKSGKAPSKLYIPTPTPPTTTKRPRVASRKRIRSQKRKRKPSRGFGRSKGFGGFGGFGKRKRRGFGGFR